MATIDLTEHLEADDSYGDDTWRTPRGVVLDIVVRRGQQFGRFSFGFVGPDGECRRVTGGPILPGPYAYGFPLSWAITANPEHSTAAECRRNRAAGTERDAQLGDIVVFRGHQFRIDPAPNDNIELTLVSVVPGSVVEDAAAAAVER